MNYTTTHTRSVLQSLRSLIPERDHITPDEALRIAELQAARLLALHGVTTWPVPREVITELPKIRILPSSNVADGASFWDARGSEWIILLSRRDSWRRQRFTLAHEYHHIVSHTARERLFHDTRTRRGILTADRQAEQAADYFAGCLLVPRTMLKRAWASGIQRTDALARTFDVSEQAIAVRLRQTGLVESRGRTCTPPSTYTTSPRPRQVFAGGGVR